jgi:hypothetical protein
MQMLSGDARNAAAAAAAAANGFWSLSELASTRLGTTPDPSLHGFKTGWELKSGIIVSNLFDRWDGMRW